VSALHDLRLAIAGLELGTSTRTRAADVREGAPISEADGDLMPRRWWNPWGRPDEPAVSVHGVLVQILTRLRALEAQGEEVLMASADIKAALAKIDAATDNIANDVQRLKDRILPGMTEQEVAEIQVEADRIATKLEGLAADPDNPDPA